MEKIVGQISSKSLPVVCPELGRLFDYMTDIGHEQKLTWYKLLVALENGKRHELLYSRVNTMYQVRCKWDSKRGVYRVCGYSVINKKTFGHVQCFTIDDADYAIRELEKQITNECIMNNTIMDPFLKLRDAIILQAFDDYRLFGNRIHDAQKQLRQDKKSPCLSRSKRAELKRHITLWKNKMDDIRYELRCINPQYAMKLKIIGGAKYRTNEAVLKKIGGI